MEACDINNKNEIEKFVHRYGGKISSQMGVGLSVERNSSEIRGVFFGEELAKKAAIAVGKKINQIVPGLVTRISYSPNSYTVTIPVTEPKLQLMREVAEGVSLPDYPIVVQEGNQYFVNGEVYPTYGDALDAAGRGEITLPERIEVARPYNKYLSNPDSVFSAKTLTGEEIYLEGREVIKYDSDFGEILYHENDSKDLVMLKSAEMVVKKTENFLEENSEMVNFNLDCL